MDADGTDQAKAFPQTNWSQVRQAGHLSRVGGEQALGTLLDLYRPALKTHLVAARRISPEQAEDVLHDFIKDKVIERALVAGADPQRGRFRTYLLTALDRYLVSALRHDAAQKRAPGGGFVALEDVEHIPLAATGQSAAADVEWARQVILETVRRLQAECEATGHAAAWAMFASRVVQPILHGETPEPYDELVARLGFQTPTQASNALVTAKRMFVRTLRAVVAEYAGDDSAVDAELGELRAILSQAGA